jgi:hypothetical protein
MTHAQALRAIDDAIFALQRAVADATIGNPSDSNISTLNSIISSLQSSIHLTRLSMNHHTKRLRPRPKKKPRMTRK